MSTTLFERQNVGQTVSSPFAKLATDSDVVLRVILVIALGQFMFFTWLTLDQPIVDLWGFRTPQTAIPVSYFLRTGHWLAPVVPIFGEPWVAPFEFPFFQWCVALLVWLTGAPVDGAGRVVAAFFTTATLWPLFLITKTLGLGRRTALVAGTLWLTAPVIIFFGRSFLIETTVVFLSAGWLAFYLRTLRDGCYVDWVAGTVFGVLSALVKITGFAGFVLVGFVYTCSWVWRHRDRLAPIIRPLVLGGATVLLPAVAFLWWNRHADPFLAQNPLADLLRTGKMHSYYFGALSDRWSAALWDVIRLRALPQALGVAWYVLLYGLIRIGVRNRLFPMVLTLLAAYLSGFLIFPVLQRSHFYYQVEVVLFLCTAAAILTEALLRRGRSLEGYLFLAVIVVGQLWSFYAGIYFNVLEDDLHKHPYYQTGLKLKELTPPDSVIVAFGLGYGADLPYFADRRAIVLANWFPVPVMRQVLFDERDRWLGGREIGAIVDCSVYEVQDIGPRLVPIRDELRREFSGKTVEVKGSFYGAAPPSKCDIFLPPDDPITKGRKLLDRGLHDEAVAVLQRATVLEPTNAEAWANLAFAYERRGNVQDAIDAGVQTLKLNPNHYYAEMILAHAFLQQKQWNEVIKHALAAESDAPSTRERSDALTLAASGAFRSRDVKRGCDFLGRAGLKPSAEIMGDLASSVCNK